MQKTPLLSLLVAALFSLALALWAPPMAGPDETAHMAYVTSLSRGQMPQIGGKHQADLLTGVTFQAQHPPLFYALAMPLVRVANGNFALANKLIRCLGVLFFIGTVWLSFLLVRELSEESSSIPVHTAFFVATNPHLLFTSSMTNNDGLSIFLGTACLWFTARAAKSEKRSHFLMLAGLGGGLALLTKATALAAVLGAAVLIWRYKHRSSAKNAVLSTTLGLLIFSPWLFYMQMRYGTLAPRQFEPLFAGGLIEALTQPTVSIYGAYIVWGEMWPGVALPLWQMHSLFGDSEIYFYIEWFFGLLYGAAFLWLAWKQEQQWVIVFMLTLFTLIFAQAMLRDKEALLFASRYGPTAGVPLAFVFASFLAKQSALRQKAFLISWSVSAALLYGYIWNFLGKAG